MPARWLTRYDYEFCWRLRTTLAILWQRLRRPGHDDNPYLVRWPADYLVLHLMLEEAASAVEMTSKPLDDGEVEEFLYELADEDDETLVILFSDMIHPASNESWHPDNWSSIPKEWTGVLRQGKELEAETTEDSAAAGEPGEARHGIVEQERFSRPRVAPCAGPDPPWQRQQLPPD